MKLKITSTTVEKKYWKCNKCFAIILLAVDFPDAAPPSIAIENLKSFVVLINYILLLVFL